MANEQQHQGATPPLPEPAQPAFKGAARRRFAKTGAAALGAALTLKSQPGMACTICKSPSAVASANISRQPRPGVVCQGLSPGYWKNHTSSWSTSCAPSTRFQKYFKCSYGSPFYGKTMLTLCSPQSYDKNNVAMHIVAAYQNALKGYTSFLTPDKVQAIWTEYWNTGGPGLGYYTPQVGTRWYGAQIVDYLFGTMD